MTRHLGVLVAHTEDPGLILNTPKTGTTVNLKGSGALFWLQWALHAHDKHADKWPSRVPFSSILLSLSFFLLV